MWKTLRCFHMKNQLLVWKSQLLGAVDSDLITHAFCGFLLFEMCHHGLSLSLLTSEFWRHARGQSKAILSAESMSPALTKQVCVPVSLGPLSREEWHEPIDPESGITVIPNIGIDPFSFCLAGISWWIFTHRQPWLKPSWSTCLETPMWSDQIL